MSTYSIQQKAKAILDTSYQLIGKKDKKSIEKTKQYINTLITLIEEDVEEEKKQL